MSNTDQSTEPKVTKSIVPSKYSGRYKNGGDDALAVFIKEQIGRASCRERVSRYV